MFKSVMRLIGPRSRGQYWSCSKFARWVTKTFGRKAVIKPQYATLEEWDEWKKNSQKTSPFVYWFTEEFLDMLQNFIYFPYDLMTAIRYYVYNRFVCETHKLKSDLEPGRFHEFETKVLHCLFTDLVRFVEVEKAWMQVCCGSDPEFHRPWYTKNPLTRLKPFVNARAGVKYLEWEMSLKEEEWDDELQKYVAEDTPTGQAIVAKEVYELYHWWKNIRPNRPDPYVLAGYEDFRVANRLDELGIGIGRLPADLREEQSRIFQKAREIEQEYENEDDRMLIRLIEIRRGMWT